MISLAEKFPFKLFSEVEGLFFFSPVFLMTAMCFLEEKNHLYVKNQLIGNIGYS